MASTDPAGLRSRYEKAFDATPDPDGSRRLGDVTVLIDGRDNLAVRDPEAGRVTLDLHVDDDGGTAAHLDGLGVTWLVEVEFRQETVAWFGTLLDPDGNCLQISELTDAYWTSRGR